LSSWGLGYKLARPIGDYAVQIVLDRRTWATLLEEELSRRQSEAKELHEHEAFRRIKIGA
jgi:hypothetical protein